LLVITSKNEEETREIGRILGKKAVPGMFIALKGELGSGKTVFVQGFARGAEVRELVNSPSYVLMNVYRGRVELYHFDFYRLEEEDELLELDLEEYFYGDGVTLVEWADKFPLILPAVRLEIEIKRGNERQDFFRHLYCKTSGGFDDSFLEEVKKYASTGY